MRFLGYGFVCRGTGWRLETLLAENVGVSTVTVGGRSVGYADLLKQYDYWQARLRANRERARELAH